MISFCIQRFSFQVYYCLGEAKVPHCTPLLSHFLPIEICLFENSTAGLMARRTGLCVRVELRILPFVLAEVSGSNAFRSLQRTPVPQSNMIYSFCWDFFSEYNKRFFIANPHGFNCGQAGQSVQRRKRFDRWKKLRLCPKHCNLMVSPLKNTSQDTFRHQVVSFSMNNELDCVLAFEYFAVKPFYAKTTNLKPT